VLKKAYVADQTATLTNEGDLRDPGVTEDNLRLGWLNVGNVWVNAIDGNLIHTTDLYNMRSCS